MIRQSGHRFAEKDHATPREEEQVRFDLSCPPLFCSMLTGAPRVRTVRTVAPHRSTSGMTKSVRRPDPAATLLDPLDRVGASARQRARRLCNTQLAARQNRFADPIPLRLSLIRLIA
jgi:hypothetical protein